MKIKPLYYHLALAAALISIFIESSIPGDRLPSLEMEYSDKLIHFSIYLVLYILFFYSLKNQSKSVKLRKFAPEFALLFTAFYGMTDEIHQYFVPNRSSEVADWVADILGAAVMYMIMKMRMRMRKELLCLMVLAAGLIYSGCSSSKDTDEGFKFEIIQSEAWIDLMPGSEKREKNFNYSIEIKVTSEDLLKDADFVIRNFEVELENIKKYRQADYSTLIINENEFLIKMNKQGEVYISNYNELPNEVRFSFDVYFKGKKIKTIQTKNIPINKVY